MSVDTKTVLAGLAIVVIGGAVYLSKSKETAIPEETEPPSTPEEAREQAIDNLARENDVPREDVIELMRSPGVWQGLNQTLFETQNDVCETARLLGIKRNYLAETEYGSVAYWETEGQYWLAQSRCEQQKLAGTTGKACCASCAMGEGCDNERT